MLQICYVLFSVLVVLFCLSADKKRIALRKGTYIMNTKKRIRNLAVAMLLLLTAVMVIPAVTKANAMTVQEVLVTEEDTDYNVSGRNSSSMEAPEFVYIPDGTLTTAESETTEDRYIYTVDGAVASVVRNNKYCLEFSYDTRGNLTEWKESRVGAATPDTVTLYYYDAADRMIKAVRNGALLVEYEYADNGWLQQKTDGAGNVTCYEYDEQKKPVFLETKAADGTVLYQEKNTFDANGSVIVRKISGSVPEAAGAAGTFYYNYDEQDRLIKEQGTYGTISYTYDVMGNRLTKTENGVTTSYVYDLHNRLLSETENGETTTYTYDILGNLTEKTDKEGITVYKYNALNQLVSITNPAGTCQENAYDAFGIRSAIKENGIVTDYMSYNGMVLAGYSESGQRTEQYCYGKDILAECVLQTGDSDRVEETLYYYLKNSHGDIIGQTDAEGKITAAYAYTAFGVLTGVADVSEEDKSGAGRFLYAGEQYDEISGLYYLRARSYDADTGRFTQEDTYLGDGPNLYVYVHNNPVKYVDPSGHVSYDCYDDCEDGDDKDRVEGMGAGPYGVPQTTNCGTWYGSSGKSTGTSAGSKAYTSSGYYQDVNGKWHGSDGKFVSNTKAGMATTKVYTSGTIHGNSLNSTSTNYGYALIDKSTNEILKFGETLYPSTRYSQNYLNSNNAVMKVLESGSKEYIHYWQYDMNKYFEYMYDEFPSLLNSKGW